MKALLLISAWLLVWGGGGSGEKDLVQVRELYYKASSSKAAAQALDAFLSAPPDIDKVLLSGYKGMCSMIKANYTWNPYSKLSYFNKGRDLLDEAIRQAPANTELRFLRFCVQTNAPAFLGYTGKIVEDKTIILNGYALSKDQDLRDRIKRYLGASNYCTEADKALLK